MGNFSSKPPYPAVPAEHEFKLIVRDGTQKTTFSTDRRVMVDASILIQDHLRLEPMSRSVSVDLPRFLWTAIPGFLARIHAPRSVSTSSRQTASRWAVIGLVLDMRIPTTNIRAEHAICLWNTNISPRARRACLNTFVWTLDNHVAKHGRDTVQRSMQQNQPAWTLASFFEAMILTRCEQNEGANKCWTEIKSVLGRPRPRLEAVPIEDTDDDASEDNATQSGLTFHFRDKTYRVSAVRLRAACPGFFDTLPSAPDDMPRSFRLVGLPDWLEPSAVGTCFGWISHPEGNQGRFGLEETIVLSMLGISCQLPEWDPLESEETKKKTAKAFLWLVPFKDVSWDTRYACIRRLLPSPPFKDDGKELTFTQLDCVVGATLSDIVFYCYMAGKEIVEKNIYKKHPAWLENCGVFMRKWMNTWPIE